MNEEKTMIYVARFSDNINADIKRNWSAWMTPGLAGSYEDCKQDIADGYAHGEIREFPEYPGCYAIVHHEGLSSYLLNAENENTAIKEAIETAKSGKIDGSGFGIAAINCKLVKTISRKKINSQRDLHILICEDIKSEN